MQMQHVLGLLCSGPLVPSAASSCPGVFQAGGGVLPELRKQSNSGSTTSLWIWGSMPSSSWGNLHWQSLSSTPAARQNNLSCKAPMLFQKHFPLFPSDSAGLWWAGCHYFFFLIKLPRVSPCEARVKKNCFSGGWGRAIG